MNLTRLALALAVAAPLAAQQPDSAKGWPMRRGEGMEGPGMMGHMMEMSDLTGPMTRGMVYSPAHLLAHRDALHLTDAQVAKLTTLRDAAQASHDAAMAEMRTHGKALATALAAPAPDTAQMKPHFQAEGAAMMQAHWAMLSAAAQARAVLTDTQRARVEGWADAMEQMMPMMHRMPGAMMHSGPDSMHH
jgi:Spy/CpxP family protein refolding chaperone